MISFFKTGEHLKGMDDYIQLNMNFMRAMQNGNADAALFFASEIEKKFPENEGVKQFKEILMKHSSTIASERGVSIPSAQGGEESSGEDDEDIASSSSSDAEDSSGSDGDGPAEATFPTHVPARPSNVSPPSRLPRQPVQHHQPSIRNLVTMHPNREIDDEVDRMFEDADRQIAAEVQRYSNSRK